MIIKISIGGQPSHADISQFIGYSSGSFEGHEISVNSGIEVADAWFIIEDIEPTDDFCDVPPNQVHFLSAETSYPQNHYFHPSRRDFLAQFHNIHTCHPTNLPGANHAPPFLPWMVNANHGSIFSPHARDINFFSELKSLSKDKPLSIFCSQQDFTAHHRLRFAFADHLKNHFGETIDWFGNGVNPLPEKWDGLARYERTVVLENRTDMGIYTEKILDPFLALTQPIYSGAPNIGEYLPVGHGHQIDIRDFAGSVRRIEKLIEKPVSAEEKEALILGKTRVLGELHFIRRILRIAEREAKQVPQGSSKLPVRLKTRKEFMQQVPTEKDPMSFEDKIYSLARRAIKGR